MWLKPSFMPSLLSSIRSASVELQIQTVDFQILDRLEDQIAFRDQNGAQKSVGIPMDQGQMFCMQESWRGQ